MPVGTVLRRPRPTTQEAASASSGISRLPARPPGGCWVNDRGPPGGKTDDLYGSPIKAQAYVKGLTDGRFRYATPMRAGSQANLGPMADLEIGSVDVLVS